MAKATDERPVVSPEGVPIEEMPGWDPLRGVLVHRTRERERELERAEASRQAKRSARHGANPRPRPVKRPA